jgi:nicotinamide riboside transporter PnuC
MRVAVGAVLILAQLLVQVVLAAAVQVVHLVRWERQLQLTPEAAVAVVVRLHHQQVAQAVQVLSLFLTLAHNVVQAAQSHQAVVALFTHSQLAVHIQLN